MEERLFCSMYIITYAYELENLKVFELEIKPPPELAEFFRSSGDHPLSQVSN